MVQPAVRTGSFDSVERAGLFHDEDLRLITLRVETKLAELPLSDITALPAERQPVFDGANGVRQPQGIFTIRLQDMKRQSLCGLLSNAGETDKLSNETGEQSLLINGHR